MIFDKVRMAKLSGLMTESKGGIKNSMADQFGGGKEDKEQFLDGEVSTADHDLHEGEDDESVMPEADEAEEGMHHVEARRKKHHDDDREMDEASLREMIRKEMSMAKKEVEEAAKEEQEVREAVRREIRSVLRSRGVSLGGTGFGFKR